MIAALDNDIQDIRPSADGQFTTFCRFIGDLRIGMFSANLFQANANPVTGINVVRVFLFPNDTNSAFRLTRRRSKALSISFPSKLASDNQCSLPPVLPGRCFPASLRIKRFVHSNILPEPSWASVLTRTRARSVTKR
jgi:hypothetical protein